MPRITISVPDKTPQPYRFHLDRQLVTLGRGSENDVVIESVSISVKHAEMRRVEGGHELIDLGSTNGMKVDGVRHGVIMLHDGLVVKFGDVEFYFQLTDEEKEYLSVEVPGKTSRIKDARKEEKAKDVEKVEEVKQPEKVELPEKVEEPEKDKEERKEEKKDDEEEEAESDSEIAASKKSAKEKPKSGAYGVFMFWLFLILAACAFFAGMAIRYQKDTGHSLIDAIKAKARAGKVSAPAVPVTPK